MKQPRIVRPVVSPFTDLVEMRIIEQADGKARVSVAERPELLNSWGVIHGGVISTLVDNAAGLAVFSALTQGESCATVDLMVKFLQAGRGDLWAQGTVLQRGRRLATAEVEVRDSRSVLVAKGLATFAIRQ